MAGYENALISPETTRDSFQNMLSTVLREAVLRRLNDAVYFCAQGFLNQQDLLGFYYAQKK
jgi:hypothetical protein